MTIDVLRHCVGAVDEADVIVHHNGDKFDDKELNARVIYHAHETIRRSQPWSDTLKAARKELRLPATGLTILAGACWMTAK